nr:tetratricopeptide repeat protein [Saprospiraceae bacterium]
SRKVGESVTILVQKPGFQVLGADDKSVTVVIPNDPQERVRIAIVRQDDFDQRVKRITNILEKRIAEQSLKIDSLIAQRSNGLTEDERAALTAQITKLYQQLQELEANKTELAQRLAQTDLDEASGFARDALKKFVEEGDLQAALAIMSQEKLDEFWDNVQSQEEKVRRAKAQAVENYMIRARMLTANFEFPAAYRSYLQAIEKDSFNFENISEAAFFLHKQNQYQWAMPLYQRAMTLAQTDKDRATLLNNLGLLLEDNESFAEAEAAFQEALKIYRRLVEKNSNAFLPDVAGTLNNLGILLSAKESYTEAEAAYLEALEAFRQLAQKNPDIYLPDLAAILNNLGNLYLDKESYTEAEATFQEALEIRWELAQGAPDTYLPDLAGTLYNMGNLLLYKESFAEAEAVFNGTVEAYRLLAQKNPDVYLPDLATALHSWGSLKKSTMDWEAAINYYTESLDIRRQLAERSPQAQGLNFSQALLAQALFCKDWLEIDNKAGCREQSLQYLEEAKGWLSRFPEGHPRADAFRSGVSWLQRELETYAPENLPILKLQKTIIELESQLDAAGDEATQLSWQIQIVAKWDSLSALRPGDGTIQTRLANACGNLAWYHLFNRQPEAAEAAARKGLAADASEEWLNTNLALALLYLGKWKEAKAVYEEWMDKPYDEENSWRDIFLQDLDALEKAGVGHPDVGKARALLAK